MVCCGTQPDDWAAVAALAESYTEILPGFGLHPWYIGSSAVENDWPAALVNWLERFPAACVGEIGLDRNCSGWQDGRQQATFVAQLAIARDLGRVAQVHCVRGWGKLMAILAEFTDVRIVLHGFAGSRELVEQIVTLQANVWFSFSGSVVGWDTAALRERIRAVPLERLLLESDAPDMVPHGWNSELSEPACLPLIAEAVASLRGMEMAELVRAATANAQQLFASWSFHMGSDFANQHRKRP
jgi:TatD DNase family protein